MTKEEIIRKLTSRKLWVAICEFVSMLIIAIGYTESAAAQVAALIMAGAGAVAYVIGEGLTDAARTKAVTITEPDPKPDVVVNGFAE